MTPFFPLSSSPSTSPLSQLAQAAQDFSYRYLSTFSKALYVAKAIEMHNRRFIGVSKIVARLKEADLESFGAFLSAVEHMEAVRL